jgi:hypothetical protein
MRPRRKHVHRLVIRTYQALPIKAVLALACAVLLAGCVGGRPACESLPGAIELTLTADSLTPSSPAVCRGTDVTLTVTSEVDGVVHIHGYDAEVPATEVSTGETLELAFTAVRSGQFPIELHPDEDPQGVSVGIFTVHEP